MDRPRNTGQSLLFPPRCQISFSLGPDCCVTLRIKHILRDHAVTIFPVNVFNLWWCWDQGACWGGIDGFQEILEEMRWAYKCFSPNMRERILNLCCQHCLSQNDSQQVLPNARWGLSNWQLTVPVQDWGFSYTAGKCFFDSALWFPQQ